MDRALEQVVWQRAGGRCEYCRRSQQFDDTTFQIDHIIAEWKDAAPQDDDDAIPRSDSELKRTSLHVRFN